MAHYIQPQLSQSGLHWIQADQPCLPSSSFRDMMYAFPKPRHTGRVMKPRSAGNSPSSGRWRLAASHGSPMYQPIQNQSYQAPINPAVLASAMRRRQATRPISWHPASLESTAYSSPPYYQTTAPESLAVMGPSAHSLDTTPPTLADGSMLPSYASTPNGAFAFNTLQDPTPMQQSTFMDMSGLHIDPVTWDNGVSNLTTMTQPILDSWPFDMMTLNNSIPSADVTASGYASAPSSGYLTGPSTPDFLPIQHPENNSKPNSDAQPQDELVGMGLYSQPDPFLDSFHEVSGKGLKLEETFTPSSDDETDDSKDAENEDDDLDSTEPGPAAQVQKQPNPEAYKQPANSTGSMMHKSFFFDDEDLEQQTMSGPQQPFNLGSQPCMNYGYGWI